MAPPTTQQRTPGPSIEEAFLADRLLFWHRFTSATTGGIVAVAVLLAALWVFIG